MSSKPGTDAAQPELPLTSPPPAVPAETPLLALPAPEPHRPHSRAARTFFQLGELLRRNRDRDRRGRAA